MILNRYGRMSALSSGETVYRIRSPIIGMAGPDKSQTSVRKLGK
jgi:hypothetical protein